MLGLESSKGHSTVGKASKCLLGWVFVPPSKAPIVSLSKKLLPSMLSTGWFQEWIQV